MNISKNSASSQPSPQQATQQQVEQVIASALPLTGMLPVVEAPTSMRKALSSRERVASQRRCASPV